ncbi:SPOR domain-containing protein [Granulosicoccus antarcticus]|uniref:Cell division protein DedD n=1 Tax=Granulosicoccus antarcticus IMCC3135 TaxID=1192854 RepID=A0A2Z2NVI0_9GAMM|nr:SPOR domain-containing protein [Granulosicoccus antarcticus]ASJ75329.1 Cell division protein DedD [Granulosicoccus antarcticus IMCC3135]
MSSFENEDSGNIRQRLWGAAVFIAVMVIVLPLLLDGAGSESQFRRVEKLREEPLSIVDTEGNSEVQPIPSMRSLGQGGVPLQEPSDIASDLRDKFRVGEDELPDYMKAEKEVREALQQTRSKAPLTAWVIQAGSFNDHENAVAVRNRLREGGFASFVRDREVETEPFRVLVGPMISEVSAKAARRRVTELLGVETMVLTYP